MINVDKKFLFIHPQKCAGSSLRGIFRNEYSDGKLSEELEPTGSGHWRSRQWKQYTQQNNIDFDSLFKIGVVRNPWDRAVSYYHHMKTHKGYDKPFWRFVLQGGYLCSTNYSIYSKFTIDNEMIVDCVVRQENFDSDVKNLLERLNIIDYNIPHDKHNTGRTEYDYRKYYTDPEWVDYIYNVSQFEINKFGYKF